MVLLPSTIVISLTLAFHHSAIEQELEMDRMQEAQLRRQDEERRREQSMREAQQEEERQRRVLEERNREHLREEARAEELKFQRDQDRRKREEMRLADDEWRRTEEERRLAHHPLTAQQHRVVATENVTDEGWQPVSPGQGTRQGYRPQVRPAPNRVQSISPPAQPVRPPPAAPKAAEPVFEI